MVTAVVRARSTSFAIDDNVSSAFAIDNSASKSSALNCSLSDSLNVARYSGLQKWLIANIDRLSNGRSFCVITLGTTDINSLLSSDKSNVKPLFLEA